MTINRIACLAFIICGVVGSAAAQTQHSVTLSCDPSVTPGVLYNLYRNGVRIQSAITQCKAIDTIASGPTYTYTMRAIKAGIESIDSNVVTAMVPTAPPPTVPQYSIGDTFRVVTTSGGRLNIRACPAGAIVGTFNNGSTAQTTGPAQVSGGLTYWPTKKGSVSGCVSGSLIRQ